jgi:hypothetical protein
MTYKLIKTRLGNYAIFKLEIVIDNFGRQIPSQTQLKVFKDKKKAESFLSELKGEIDDKN